MTFMDRFALVHDLDAEYLAALTASADREYEEILANSGSLISPSGAPVASHRPLARAVKIAITLYNMEGSRLCGDPRLPTFASRLTSALSKLQDSSGLFGGDNLLSPPDSAFTTNDVLDCLSLLDDATGDVVGAAGTPSAGTPVPAAPHVPVSQGLWTGVYEDLTRIAHAVDGALRMGGVHTPNHRWEISQALSRLEGRWPDQDRRARIEQWLAEGVDVDADGQYSERSAIYSLHVTNPSLLVMAGVLDRPDLEEIVLRNLEVIVALTGPDGTVETMHSRRQDQKERFSLEGFHFLLRRAARRTGRADFSYWASRAWDLGVSEPGDALSRVVLEPWVAGELPTPQRGMVSRRFVSGLLVSDRPDLRCAVDGSSDRAKVGRVASGLANNPTFLHAWVGGVELRSVRVSREFFGLGPFRPQSLGVEAVGAVASDAPDAEVRPAAAMACVLRERVSAGYYQPLPPQWQRPDGDYDLEFEGRFAAQMSFSRRSVDELVLDTSVRIEDDGQGLALCVEMSGPATEACVELAFPDGTTCEGAVFDALVQSDGMCRIASGGDVVILHVEGASGGRAFYEPGEEYRYMGGTDALSGPRLYVPVQVPGVCRLRVVPAS